MLTPEQEAEYWSLKGEQAARQKHKEWLDSIGLKESLAPKEDHHCEPHPDWNK